MYKELSKIRESLIEQVRRVRLEFTPEQMIRFIELKEFFALNDMPLRISLVERERLLNKLSYKLRRDLLEHYRPEMLKFFDEGKLPETSHLFLEMKLDDCGRKELKDLKWLMEHSTNVIDRINYYLSEVGISYKGVAILKDEVAIEAVIPQIKKERLCGLSNLQGAIKELKNSGLSRYQVDELIRFALDNKMPPFSFFI